MTHRYIKELGSYIDQEVVLKGWLAQKRDSKGLLFATMRDGTGFVQVVIDENVVGNEIFEQAKKMGQESSFAISGIVKKDERQFGGVEVQAKSFCAYANAEDFPITPKEHGVDFLMDKRHLWLRSKRQWAIMRVRNTIIFPFTNFSKTKALYKWMRLFSPATLVKEHRLYSKPIFMVNRPIYRNRVNYTEKQWRWRRA
jgi:asparaginyl-tRNA synthetase